MWGNLITETSFIYNFTFGFPTQHSDTLMHLTHWQYWFWFWFTYYLVLYYLLFLRLIRYRVLKMSPKLSTSFRSHGKWGDLLVCFVPISWCTNILSNSNFILRMIEWQSESSLFTLRVRGKQWYWVYKFELKALADVSSTAINIGNNFWVNKSSTQKHHYLGLVQEKHNLSQAHLTWSSAGGKQHSSNTEIGAGSLNAVQNNQFKLPIINENKSLGYTNYSATNNYYMSQSYNWRSVTVSVNQAHFTNISTIENASTKTYFNSFTPKVTRISKKSTSEFVPMRLLKNTSGTLEVRYSLPNAYIQKPNSNNFYLVVKQKRYAPTSLSSSNYYVTANATLQKNNFAAKDSLFLTQHNATRSEFTNLQSNRRLLRTRRVLVLPAHTNITLITNSFDVMHSWFIPGLGVKLDCVPGRSTHHTIHIDHAGFYYGQCAEICGRYHHHMPIRVCALPFEHFLIWWYHYGAPFFLAGNQDRAAYIKTSAKQLNW